MKTIKKTAALTLVVVALSTTAQTNWKVDASHSKMGFAVTHMMVSETEGKFNFNAHCPFKNYSSKCCLSISR